MGGVFPLVPFPDVHHAAAFPEHSNVKARVAFNRQEVSQLISCYFFSFSFLEKSKIISFFFNIP